MDRHGVKWPMRSSHSFAGNDAVRIVLVGRWLVDSVTVWFKSIHVEKLEKQKTLPEKEGKSETWLLKLIEEHKCSYSRSPLDILTRGTYI